MGMNLRKICFCGACLLAAIGALLGAVHLCVPGAFRFGYYLLRAVGYLA